MDKLNVTFLLCGNRLANLVPVLALDLLPQIGLWSDLENRNPVHP